MNSEKVPVFYDPRGTRWKILKHLLLFLASIGTILTSLFIASILIGPVLPQLSLRPVKDLPQSKKGNIPNFTEAKAKTEREIDSKRKSKKIYSSRNLGKPIIEPSELSKKKTISENADENQKHLAIGFYVNWDDSSYASLKQNIRSLDWIVPAWLQLDESSLLTYQVDTRVLDLTQASERKVSILPLVQNYHNEKWDGKLLSKIIANEKSRHELINSLVDFIEKNNFDGLVLDFEEVPTEAQRNLLRLTTALHEELKKRGKILAQAVPFDDSDWDYKAYETATDFLMLMAYDEHWSSGLPGPVASQQWFEKILSQRIRDLDPSKVIVCLGNYGYDWIDDGKEAAELTFQEVVLTARDHEAKISFHQHKLNPFFNYDEEDGSSHTVWFLDAVTTYNQIQAANRYQIAGFALWRLGSEDPSVWSIFGNDKKPDDLENLHEIKYGYDVDFEGTGEILQVEATPKEGKRDFQIDPKSRLIISEDYPTDLEQVIFYYALFLAIDWINSAFGFLLEKKEQWSLLWWIFWQRFGYRQLMYYVMLKSIWTALCGTIVGWGKLERKATVSFKSKFIEEKLDLTTG
jgi:spore germination protein YaaH